MSPSMSRDERAKWLDKRMDSTATIRAMRDASSPLDVALWLSATEAGEAIGVSSVYAKTLAVSGKIDAVPTSLGWLLDPEDVQRFRRERIEKLRQRLSQLTEDKDG